MNTDCNIIATATAVAASANSPEIIEAKYHGRCFTCAKHYSPGDPIVRVDWAHPSAPQHWMRHAGCRA